MTNLDYYLTYDHAARGRTTLLSVAIGASAGMISESLGVSAKISALLCLLIVGTIEIAQAWRYKQPSEKKRLASDVPLPSRRRSLVFLPVAALLFLVFAFIPTPRLEAAILERKLKRSVQEGPPYGEAKKLLIFGLNNGIIVSRMSLDITRHTITEAYLALPEKEHADTGVTLAQIAAYDVYVRTHVRLNIAPIVVFLPAKVGGDGIYHIPGPITTSYMTLIGEGEDRSVVSVEFDYTPETPALFIFGIADVRPAITGYLVAKRPLQRSLANAPAFALIKADHSEVAVIDVIASNLSQALDSILWVNVIFDRCHISYHGGPLLLKDVIFKECEFEAGDVLDRINRYGDNPVTLNVS